MGMRVRMRLTPRIAARMGVLMVFVVNVSVIMRERLMLMPVVVVFGEVQPHAQRHQCRRHAEHNRRKNRLRRVILL